MIEPSSGPYTHFYPAILHKYFAVLIFVFMSVYIYVPVIYYFLVQLTNIVTSCHICYPCQFRLR